jgi:hypothetical protein
MYGARCPLPNLSVLCLCVGSLSIGVCRCMKRQSVSNVQLLFFRIFIFGLVVVKVIPFVAP